MTELPACTLHQVSDHLWWFTPDSRTDRASMAIVIGNQGTLMLELGASPAHTREFFQALTDNNLALPDSAVLTHWHWDHSFGMEALDIPFAAQRETAKHLERMSAYDYGDEGLDDLVKRGIEVDFTREHLIIELDDNQRRNLKLRQPDLIFDETHHYDLGAVTCEVLHVGGDHSADSSVMYIPEDKVLFMGDCFYYTVYEEPRHYTKAVLTLIEKLESFAADYYIEGHANQITSASEMAQYFAIIKQSFKLIDQYGFEDRALLLKELVKDFPEDDTGDFLDPILAGYQINK